MSPLLLNQRQITRVFYEVFRDGQFRQGATKRLPAGGVKCLSLAAQIADVIHDVRMRYDGALDCDHAQIIPLNDAL